MSEKDIKIDSFKDKLTNVFIENYNDLTIAKDSVNETMQNMSIDYTYTYNTFCSDLMFESLSILDKIEDIDNIDVVSFLYTVINNMVNNKIK